MIVLLQIRCMDVKEDVSCCIVKLERMGLPFEALCVASSLGLTMRHFEYGMARWMCWPKLSQATAFKACAAAPHDAASALTRALQRACKAWCFEARASLSYVIVSTTIMMSHPAHPSKLLTASGEAITWTLQYSSPE